MPKLYRPKTTIEQWRILQAVVEYGGYAQAAEQLNKSQSSLNHAVNKLQQQVGIQILEVQGRKAYLTPAGKVLLRRAKLLLSSIYEVESLAINLEQGWEPEIRLVVESAFPRQALMQILAQFYPQSRGTRLQIYDSILTSTTEAIRHHQADLAITTSIPRGYLSEPLCVTTFLPVCSTQHSLVQQGVVTHNELAKQLQIVIRDTGSQPTETQGWLKAEQRWTVSHFYEAINILQSGLGFCWLPESLVMPLLQQQQLQQIQLDQSQTRHASLFLVCPTPDALGPGTTLLKQCFLEYFS